jgi:hypothetical protein
MKFLLLFVSVVGLLIINNGYGQSEMVRPSRLDLIQVETSNYDQLKSLDNQGFIINQVRDGYCVGEASPSLIQGLSKQGYKITLMQEDISGIYYNNFFTRDDRGRYLTYAEFIDTMNVIATNNPEICKLETIGMSHTNRLLLAMKISDTVTVDENEPAVYFDGNTHGDEKIGWAICFELIKYIVRNYYDNQQIFSMVNSREIWIVPMINPDGYVNSSRYNGRSVDVNRNYGWMWGNETSCGSDAFSENEATAYYNLYSKHPFVVYTTYHAGDSVISNPWSYTSYDTIPEKFLVWHLANGYSQNVNHYPYGQGSIIMYLINGSSKDYCYGFGGEVSWSIEVCNTKTPPASWIDPCFNSNRDAMLYLIRKSGQGIHGTVTDSVTGQPLFAQVLVQPRNWLSYASPTKGDFHRFYLPGTYTLITRCPGYKSDTLTAIVPNNTADSSINLNIKLIPDSTAIKNYGMKVVHTRYVTTSSNRTYPVRALGVHDGVPYQLDNTKWIVLAMAKPIQNDSGNDFTVYRSSGTGTATVKVSNNWKGPWTTVGTANSASNSFDITSAGIDTVRYVRLDATSTYNLDAVEEYVLVSGSEEIEDWKLKIENFKIYPSLVSTHLKVDFNVGLKQDVKFIIYDVLGRNVKSFEVKSGEMRALLNLRNLRSGIYFIKTEGLDRPVQRFTIIK